MGGEVVLELLRRLEILPVQMISPALAALRGAEAGRFALATKITAVEEGRKSPLPSVAVFYQETPAGSKLIFRRVPVAAAKRCSVCVDGRVRPLSSRAMTDCVVSMRCASCSWVRPAVTRALMTARASANSGARAS